MADASENGTTGQAPVATEGGGDDLTYLKAEARKAFEARDKVKNELRRLQESGLVITDEQRARYQELEAAASKAEEDRKRKEGEFDSWKAQIGKKHEAEVAEARKAAEAAQQELHRTLIGLAFAGATDYFGGDSAKTILTPEIAEAFYGRYVSVEDHEGRKSVVVKDPDGGVILDAKTGKPASFAVAIGELIEALPNKDRVLRGSGKTGSGSPGGGATHKLDTDVVALTERARQGDKTALTALANRAKAKGGIVAGPAFSASRS